MKPKNAFTLIELLTVIAVVAVLVAILVPALSGIRTRADVAKSTSNIRQLYTANFAYLNENGHFADANGWYWQGPEAGTTTWHERIATYTSLGSTKEEALAQFRAGERPPGVFAVPGRERLLDRNGGEGGGFRSGYLRSMKVFVNQAHVAQGQSKRNLLSYTSEAKTFFLIDNGGTSSEVDFNGWQINPETIANWPAHGGPNGSIVVCFMDGHTEAIDKDAIPTDWRDVFWQPQI